MRKRMMALVVALLCVFAPAVAFAGDGGLAVRMAPAAEVAPAMAFVGDGELAAEVAFAGDGGLAVGMAPAPAVAFAGDGGLAVGMAPAAEVASGIEIAPAATQPTFTVTYPYADDDGDGANDYVLEVGRMTNRFKLIYSTPASVSAPEGGAVTATFAAALSKYYFYRMTNAASADAVTYGGYEYLSTDRAVTVTPTDMHVGDASLDKATVVRDFSRNAYDTGDLYLNAGPSGHVQLAVGKSFNLYPLRNWFPIEGTNNGEPLHPDYHVRVVNLEAPGAVTATETVTNGSAKHKWTISGKKVGTALVMVTYDALVHADGMGSYTDFSAIWPENTGLFVVTVGKLCDVDGNFQLNAQKNAALQQAKADGEFFGTAAKLAGDAFDAELDVLYYADDAGASYSFAPEAGASVSVARGSIVDGALQVGDFTQEGVTVDADGTVTVGGLTTGKHVICVQKGENVAYQVVRAKAVRCRVYAGADLGSAASTAGSGSGDAGAGDAGSGTSTMGVDAGSGAGADVDAGAGSGAPGRLVVDSADGVVNAYTDGERPITRAAFEALDDAQRAAYDPLVQPGGTVTVEFDRLYHPANKLQHCYNMTAAISLEGSDGTSYEQEVSAYGGPGQYAFASTPSCQQIQVKIPAELPEGAYELTGSLLSTGFGYGGYGAHRAITYENGITDTTPIAPEYTAYFGQLPAISLDVVGGASGESDPGEEAAQQAARAFEELVDAIGAVDLDAADRIAQARSAYEVLSPAALALVNAETVTRLQQAEEQLATLCDAWFQPADIAEGRVRVIVENATWDTAAGAPWDGVLLDQQVDIDALQDNICTLLDKALDQEGLLPAQRKGDYVQAIEGLGDPESGVSCYGGAAGWMVTLNGWFINASPSAFECRTGDVREGDEIRFVYTCTGGPDVGSDAVNKLKTLSSLATSDGTLSPAFSADVVDYQLKLSAGTMRVYVKPTSKNQNFQVRTYVGDADGYEAGYRANDAIPVENGTVIYVVVGDPTWPSMSSSVLPAKIYRVTVAIEEEQAGPGGPVGPAGPDGSDAPASNQAGSNDDADATVILLNTAKVTKASVAKACKQAGKTPFALKTIVLGPKVKRIARSAFKGCKQARTLEVRTKKLKKSTVKGALKGSRIKTVRVNVGAAKANKKFAKKYKKLFVKRVAGKKARVRAA